MLRRNASWLGVYHVVSTKTPAGQIPASNSPSSRRRENHVARLLAHPREMTVTATPKKVADRTFFGPKILTRALHGGPPRANVTTERVSSLFELIGIESHIKGTVRCSSRSGTAPCRLLPQRALPIDQRRSLRISESHVANIRAVYITEQINEHERRDDGEVDLALRGQRRSRPKSGG